MMIVDSMERNENITDILTEHGIPFEIKQLPVGDYVWNGYAVERKAMSDFASSALSNHLYDQLNDLVYNLSLGSERSALIMYGDFDDLDWRVLQHVNISTFYKYVGEVFIHYPTVSFFWVENEEAFATLLSAMYHQSYSRKIEHFNFVKKTKRDDINCLIASKHFSKDQAKLLLKKYSLRQIFNMDLNTMIKFKNFGKIGVGKFIEFRGKK